MVETVRIGIVGAGGFTRRRLLPNLQAVEGAEVVAVANRSLESAERVASEFGIPAAMGDWRELVARDDVDAVLVGTQPYFHHEAVMGALEAGKHVLCQTRMATSLREAREMLGKAEEMGLKARLVPPASYERARRYVKHLLDDGYIGPVRQVFAHYLVPDYADGSAPLLRRQDHRMFGAVNPLHLGLDWDVLRPWFGDPDRVLAWGRTFTSRRTDGPGGDPIDVEMPDALTVIAEMQGGATVTCIQSGVTLFGEERVEIYGEEGTLVYPRRGDLLGARRGDDALGPLPVPEGLEETWHAEEDFVRLVRGEDVEERDTFQDGVKNIEFLEASALSLARGGWVELPLP
ncbi:MAG: Gfo/Idh/MocA family oxidoreductase [Chloroflexota bacterium]|nr:Gfo/Idh/MocA family oxidoreductase [Chloroflexota bacterium]MDE2885399.1 Gfo/Idh/MocA family oxidoreductase [Chloroflexota bacterium]